METPEAWDFSTCKSERKVGVFYHNAFETDAIKVFRQMHPNGIDRLMCPFVRKP
jgi:hypothetical protein